MTHADILLLWRILAAAGLAFALGFERELRGAPAGDRTYALIGTASAAVTAVTIHSSPQTVAGLITGIGFVGGAFVFRSESGELRGITSAATMFDAPIGASSSDKARSSPRGQGAKKRSLMARSAFDQNGFITTRNTIANRIGSAGISFSQR